MTPEELLNAHAELQVGCFFDEIEALPSGLKYAYSGTISDNFWNYAYGVNATMEDLPYMLDSIRKAAQKHNRAPAIYLTPTSVPVGLEKYLANDGVIEDVWMVYKDGKKTLSNTDLEISVAQSPTDLKAFLDIFRNAYGSGDHGASDVGYTGLPEEYPLAIQNAAPKSGVKIVNFLGKVANKPVAIASIYLKAPRVAGLYNVGVAHDVRQRGLGATISKHAIEHAKALGCTDIFLMTVPDSPVEKLYSKIGFERVFIGKIVALSS